MRKAWLLVGALAGCGRLGFDAVESDAASLDTSMDMIDPLTYRGAVLLDQPVGYWRLNDVDTIAIDEISGNNGTYSGGVAHGVGGAIGDDPNTAADFGGVDGKVEAPDIVASTGNAPFSVEAWVRPGIARYQHIVTKEPRISSMPAGGYALLCTPGAFFERIRDQGMTNYDQTVPVAIPVDVWSHLVGTYDGAVLRMYIDGEEVGSVPSALAAVPATSPLVFGAHIQGANFDGGIDEVAVYDKALSAARIAAHHTIGLGN